MKNEKQIKEMADKKFPFSWLGRPDKAREEKCKQEGFIEGYTQAQKENEELREALDWATDGWKVGTILGLDNMKKMLKIRTKFSLDKSDKGAV